MITRIDATNYRCFELLGIPLSDFCVIAGANGSGKTTLLDIPVLLGDLLRSRNVAGAFTEYRQVASTASIKHCEDDALLRLLDRMRVWFPEDGA